MKAKKLREALEQLAEEGVMQLFIPQDGSAAIVGVVGALQLDVLIERLKAEYGLPVSFEPTRFEVCRWIEADERAERDRFAAANGSAMAADLDGRPGLHGDVRLLAALRRRTLAGHPVSGRESLSARGSTNSSLREAQRRSKPQATERRERELPNSWLLRYACDDGANSASKSWIARPRPTGSGRPDVHPAHRC
jgi:hypothetical protein